MAMVRVIIVSVVVMAMVRVIMVAVVVMTVVRVIMAVMAVVVMAMVRVIMVSVTVVVGSHARLKPAALSQKQPFFHREVPLELADLLLDVGHGVLHPFRGNDAQWIQWRDQVVVGLTKFTVVARVARSPIELLGVELYPQRFSGSRACHDIPRLQAIDDDHRQNDGGNHRPDQLQPVVMWKEGGLSVLVVGVFPGKSKEQEIHQEEHRGDDPNVEAHQPIQLNPVFGGCWWGIIPVGDVQIDDRSEKDHHKHQPQVGIQTGIRVSDVLFTTP